MLPLPPNLRRFPWATLAFLAGFSTLLGFIALYYLVPSLDAARSANPVEKKSLAAYAALLLAIVLVILFSGLVLTFRVGRFFFPGQGSAQKKTQYVDAWTEAARRMPTPPPPSDPPSNV